MWANPYLQDITSVSWEKGIEECKKFNCKNPWNETSSFYEGDVLNQMYFWLDGVLQCVIAGIGLLGNIFAICIFTSKYLRSTFHAYLAASVC